jgi:hypothetical protein
MMPRTARRLPILGSILALLSACAGRTAHNGNLQPLPGSAPGTIAGTARVFAKPDDVHVPDFAHKPYEPFSRADAVAIASREWRLFGQKVDDDPPGTRPEPLPDDKPERMPGLWQRVGEYWFEGLDAQAKESHWTGKHDEWGLVFPADQDGSFAWSAAFISYVMRIAGAGDRFPYSSIHADYINMARVGGNWAVTAQPPMSVAPVVGDLICTSRALKHPVRFEDLPTPDTFPGHCDIVVDVQPGQLTVIGGNVDDAVTMKHVPIGPDGLLTNAAGAPYDSRYNWFVVLRVLYDR